VQRFRSATTEADALFRRQAAESALLLVLRAHAEVVRLTVKGAAGEPMLLTGRRGGIPVLWVSSSPTGGEGAAQDPRRPRLLALLDLVGDAELKADVLEAEVAPNLLLSPREASAAPEAETCELAERGGLKLAQRGPSPASAESPSEASALVRLTGLATVSAEGWSAPGPWTLSCSLPEDVAVAGTEPLSSRYRTTLFLNLAVMALALLLGGFAARETVRRQRSDAQAREEVRVRELERQLFHADRLTTAGRLAAGIAHEINNPLEGMANYLSLARDALARGDLEGAGRRLEGVAQGLDRAALVVRQALAHADPARSPRAPFDLARVLADTTEFVRSRGEFGRIRFETQLPEAPLVVTGSSIMLGQVATNLILNACEAQPGGGEVAVSARHDGERVVAEVADRGPGVPEADRLRIFEPFFSTKDSTGLGLAVCHSIVRDHGGDLVALGREGGGALFRISLPATKAAAKTEAA
jgi:signal transduction histidine kinase